MFNYRNNLVTYFCLLLLILSLNGFSQTSFDTTTLKKFKSEFEILKKDKALQNAQWSFYVISEKSGATIIDFNSSLALKPASTMKIVTTGAGLGLLGEDKKFVTYLETDGTIDKSSNLNGNLYIRGGGDPSLGAERLSSSISSVMKHWISTLKTLGIKSISGAVIADAELFEDDIIPPSWKNDDVGNYYAAGASALSINENLYKAVFSTTEQIGSASKIVRTEPDLPYLLITNKVSAASKNSGDNVIIYGKAYSNSCLAKGTVPAAHKEFMVKGSIPDPAYFVAFTLDKSLKDMGVEIAKKHTTTRVQKIENKFVSDKRIILDSLQSASLKEIVYHTNKKSINLYAEMILKNIAYVKTGKGTLAGGINAILDYWKSKGVEVKNLNMADGSGLSPNDRISAKQQVQILQAITKEKYYTSFLASLPVAGESGSIGNICEGSAADGNIFAKSGYMAGVRSWAGYANTKKGEKLIFSLIVNNYNCSPSELKKKAEKLMILMAELK